MPEKETLLKRAESIVKRIEAIVRPFNLEKVMQGLSEVGVAGATSSDVQNHICQSVTRSGERVLPMARLEVVAPEHLAGRVIEAIQRVIKAVSADDARILVAPIESVIRVRTGERGEEAL